MKPASLLASRMPCFHTFSCAWAAVRPPKSKKATADAFNDGNMDPPTYFFVMRDLARASASFFSIRKQDVDGRHKACAGTDSRPDANAGDDSSEARHF